MSSPKPDSGIVWLASYPKSGNTWTRAFLSNLATIMAGEEEALDVNSINRFSLGENFTQGGGHAGHATTRRGLASRAAHGSQSGSRPLDVRDAELASSPASRPRRVRRLGVVV